MPCHLAMSSRLSWANVCSVLIQVPSATSAGTSLPVSRNYAPREHRSIISRCLLVTIACPRNRRSLPGFTGWLVANLPMWQCRATRRPDTQIARDMLKPPPSCLRRLSPSTRNETSWTNRKDRSGRCRVSLWPLAHLIRTVGLGGTLISELLELDLWEPCANVTLKLNNQRNNSPFFNTFFNTWGS